MKEVAPILLIFLLIVVCSFRTKQAPTGKEIFTARCVRCHGAEGTKHFLGAKDLQKSTLTDSAIVQMIFKGKRIMPSFKSTLTNEQIESVAAYVKTLRR